MALPATQRRHKESITGSEAEALIHSNKLKPCSSSGRPPKRRTAEPVARGKKPTLPLPIYDVRYDQVGH